MDLSKQNILFFTRTMNLGGTENVVLQLCETIKSKVNNVIVCSCGGINVEKLSEMGVKHYEIDDIEKKNVLNILKIIKRLRDIIRKENITVIHTHHRMASFYTRLLNLPREIKCINTVHNTFYDKKILTKFAYKKTNLIACGEMVKKNLNDFYNIPENDICVISNSVRKYTETINELDILKKYKEDGYLLVGNIGRLTKQKGMKYFIRAIPKVLNCNKRVKFFIFGDGPQEEILKKLACDINVSENLIFMGYYKNMQNIISQLDLVVLTSLWEGLPLTPIEAFSVSKTVVATAVDGTVEIIDDGLNGFLVKPKDVDEIANKINELLVNDRLRKSFEKNAWLKYESKFSFEIFCEKYENYYRKIRDK